MTEFLGWIFPHPTPELSAMFLETDRSGGHEDAPSSIGREVDPFKTSLLAAMYPGSSSEDERLRPLSLLVKLSKMKI